MLRYYEQVGLVTSIRKEDYAYRVYDEEAVKRLQQIILLRKLQIPIKQIAIILENPDAATAIKIFKSNIAEIQTEMDALTTIKSALEILVAKIEELAAVRVNLNLLTDKDVRIIYLPPATVASIHCVGNKPEDRATALLREFVQKTDLAKRKPDFRHYGFNHPNGSNDDDHGYEYWVTIPENMTVEPPFQKKAYAGGLYAAHTVTFGEFEKWHWLWAWVEASDKFMLNLGDPACMDGLLEEHFNYFNQYQLKHFDKDRFQMDLLIPIKEKE